MNKKIQRNYLEINSLTDLKDSKISPEGYVVQLVQPSDFQLNKFFYKNIGKKHHWVDRLAWTEKQWTEYISNKKDNIIFVLWGSPSLSKLNLIDKSKHFVTISSHPSGLSCNRSLREYDSFNNTNHFKKINYKLNKKIIWQI